jgi:NADH dehydrogenase
MFTALGKMGALGRRSAVAEVFGIKLSGFLAWWLWRTIYLMKLPGLDRKIRVATDWTLDLVLPPDITQLKTDRALGVRREYFEPGQVVFREGDRGDWLYIVTEGEVEVLKDVPGRGETSLRRLGVGECFGEIALVSDTARSATVRAVSATNVLAVDREAFQAMFATMPLLRGFVEQLIASRNA